MWHEKTQEVKFVNGLNLSGNIYKNNLQCETRKKTFQEQDNVS